MTTCKDELLRRGPQRRPRARTHHARVVGPLVLSCVVQLGAIVLAVLLGVPLLGVLFLILGIAVLTAVLSRRTVSSLVAGAGIRVAQPYGPGEQIRVFVPSLDRVEDAEIVRVGAANTTLMTASGIVLVPNAQMLRGHAHSS